MGASPVRPASALTGVVPALARGIAHALTMVLLLAMTLWPEDHYFDSIPLPDPYGYNGMGMVREHLPGDHDLSARQEFSFRDGCSHRFTRDDSFSVLARRIESIFAPASTK